MSVKVTHGAKGKKSDARMSRKTRKSSHSTPEKRQKSVTNAKRQVRLRLNLERLKNNLGQMVTRLSVGGKVQAYEQIAVQLSTLAGLHEDRLWGWRYVASVHSGTVVPSKRFIRALALMMEHVNPRQKQWFYFARRKSVAAFYDKSILREMIFTQMQHLGYKPVTYTRYAELKRRKAA